MNHLLKLSLHTCWFWAAVLLICCSGIQAWAQESDRGLTFVANQGQWDDQILFRTDLPGGRCWLENGQFTYVVWDAEAVHDWHHHDDEEHEHAHEGDDLVQAHAFTINFLGANASPKILGEHQTQGIYNFFQGRDRSRWQSHVKGYERVVHPNLYKGIDLITYSQKTNLKYDLEVAPGADPQQIRMRWSGVGGLQLVDGKLQAKTSVRLIEEMQPVAYQLVEGKRIPVSCEFRLIDNQTVGFTLGAYDESLSLIIDPVVVASTNSGTTSTAFGHCATYDNAGNIYAGGRSFDVGYPTDSGSFQINFGGIADYGISKFNPDATALIYATYVGGADSDSPESMIVNSNGELCMLGNVSSADFPVSGAAFDTTLNGASDMAITILSDSGDVLIASTLVGGDGTDAANLIGMNYADNFRGEIEVDDENNVLIASISASPNFPVTAGAIQDTLNGPSDAVFLKMPRNLSSLIFSTYLGGTDHDSGYGIKEARNGDLVVCGGAGADFPTTAGAATPNYPGGAKSGFVARLDSLGQNLVAATYFGSSADDQNFFVQIDPAGFVYLYGQSTDTLIFATPGRYQGVNRRNFVYKTNPMLDSVLWISTLGPAQATQRYAPIAFLVDDCYNIYGSGHLSNAINSNFDTVDAVASATNLGFYLFSLEPDATNLQFGSYYGNSGSHVDGGTSRFDKRGVVYQATCTPGLFPTTTGAYSTNSNGGSWDITVFKIDFELDLTVAYSSVTPNNFGCAPYTANFDNVGSIGIEHFWDFDDGTTDTAQAPVHTFNNPGTYRVRYVALDSTTCNVSDTTYLTVYVFGPDTVDLGPDVVSCDTAFTIQASLTSELFSTYTWNTGPAGSSITVDTSGTYWVEALTPCGLITDTMTVDFQGIHDLYIGPDTTVCFLGFPISATVPGATYLWSTQDTTPTINVDTTGQFRVTVTRSGCQAIDTIDIGVTFADLGSQDTLVCSFDNFLLDAENVGTTYLWSTGDTIAQIQVTELGQYWVEVSNGICQSSDTINIGIDSINVSLGPDTVFCDSSGFVTPSGSSGVTYQWDDGGTAGTRSTPVEGTYWVTAFRGFCSAVDSIHVDIEQVGLSLNSPVSCGGEPIQLSVDQTYPSTITWSNGEVGPTTLARETGTYSYQSVSEFCVLEDSTQVFISEDPVVDLGDDLVICEGESVVLQSSTTASAYLWSTGDTTAAILVSEGGTYTLQMFNGPCEGEDMIDVEKTDPIDSEAIFMPNVITPNFDGMNDELRLFTPQEQWIDSYLLEIYSRWGHRIFRSEHIDISWDGTADGVPVKDGVYLWRLDFTSPCTGSEVQRKEGSVTVIR